MPLKFQEAQSYIPIGGSGGLGFRVWGSGCRSEGLGLRIWGLGFRSKVSGFGV